MEEILAELERQTRREMKRKLFGNVTIFPLFTRDSHFVIVM